MLIEQVDRLDSEPPERALDGLPDVGWLAVQAGRAFHRARIEIGTEIEPEFRRDDNLVPQRSQRFADQFFIGVRTIDLRGVEERDAAFHRRPEKSDLFPLVFRWPIRGAHAHAAEPERRYFQAAVSKFAFLHWVSAFRLDPSRPVRI